MLDTNLTGALNVISSAREHLQAGAPSSTSVRSWAFAVFPGDAAYGASKAGLAGLTRTLAIELAGGISGSTWSFRGWCSPR